jgi:hypothetical protein
MLFHRKHQLLKEHHDHFLQQNDIVYFKPRTPIVDPAFEGAIRPIMYVTSLGSLVTSILVLVKLGNN